MTKITFSTDEHHQIPSCFARPCAKIQHKMKIIFFLIGVSLLVAIGFLATFFWAVNDGQFEDDYTPSVRILLDDKIEKND